MANDKNLLSNDPKGKKGKKTSPWVYVGVVAASGVVYYLYKQHVANAASSSGTTAAIDPLTGAPYAPGVGSLASGGSSGATGSGASAIDPATNVPYATELANATATNQANASLISTLNGIISGFGGSGQKTDTTTTTTTGGATTIPAGGGGSTGGGVSTQTLAPLADWRLNAAAIIANAEHVSQAQAGQAISQYLQGKPITNVAAARGLANVVKNSGPPPTASGIALPIRVAKQPASKTPTRVTPTPQPAPAPRAPTPRAPAWHAPEVLPKG